ncbi:MAG: OmpH family outer membrane protein [Bacteroidales bacterium]|nr:OmpH family outer membrane protein [Bacteroidales bacterium]
MKRLSLILILAFSLSIVSAQKVAYIHRDSVFNNMPEAQKAQEELNVFLNQVQTEIETMQGEYQKKIEIFNQNVNSYTESVKTNKVTEIQDLEKRIQDFQVNAQTDYLAKQKELIVPIRDKFDKAVETVRLRLKYDVVMNIGPDVLYVNPKFIITEDVMKELGIK